MDGFSISNLPGVSLRLQDSDRSSKSMSFAQSASSVSPPVDLVEMSGAVPPPDPFDKVIFSNRARQGEVENFVPSLSSLLDEIKNFMESALDALRTNSKSFFEDLESLRSTLGDAKNADLLRTVGELVAVSDGTDSSAFLEAAGELVNRAAGPESVLLGADQGPEALEVAVSDLTLSIQPNDPNGFRVNLDSVKLSIGKRAQEQAPVFTPEVPLLGGNARNKVEQERSVAIGGTVSETARPIKESTSPSVPAIKGQPASSRDETPLRSRSVELEITKGQFSVSLKRNAQE